MFLKLPQLVLSSLLLFADLPLKNKLRLTRETPAIFMKMYFLTWGKIAASHVISFNFTQPKKFMARQDNLHIHGGWWSLQPQHSTVRIGPHTFRRFPAGGSKRSPSHLSAGDILFAKPSGPRGVNPGESRRWCWWWWWWWWWTHSVHNGWRFFWQGCSVLPGYKKLNGVLRDSTRKNIYIYI